jgi:hypothetical protein
MVEARLYFGKRTTMGERVHLMKINDALALFSRLHVEMLEEIISEGGC